ncbi:MAG: DUF502 domain-containing protein [Bacteroidota bacterium]
MDNKRQKGQRNMMGISSSQKHRGFWGLLRTSFVRGIVIVIPVMLTFWILRVFYRVIDGTLTPTLERILGLRIPGLGFVVAILIVFLIGLASRAFIGKQILAWMDEVMKSIPLVRTIYSASKDLIRAFSLGSKGKAFRKVLVIEYPRKGLYTVAFVTNEVVVESSKGASEPMYNVYVPNPPNPTSGVFLLVPKLEAIEMQLSIEEAMKLVLSGGIVSPSKLDLSRSYPETSIEERSGLAEE